VTLTGSTEGSGYRCASAVACKRALGTRAPMAIPQDQNLRWSLDFVMERPALPHQLTIRSAGGSVAAHARFAGINALAEVFRIERLNLWPMQTRC